MNWLALTLGLFLFVHYGCAILKHDAKQSTFTIKLSLIAIMVSAVLVIRASILGIMNGWYNFYDLCVALILYGYAKSILSLYLWSFGMSYVDAAKKVFLAGGIRLRSIAKQVRDAL